MCGPDLLNVLLQFVQWCDMPRACRLIVVQFSYSLLLIASKKYKIFLLWTLQFATHANTTCEDRDLKLASQLDCPSTFGLASCAFCCRISFVSLTRLFTMSSACSMLVMSPTLDPDQTTSLSTVLFAVALSCSSFTCCLTASYTPAATYQTCTTAVYLQQAYQHGSFKAPRSPVCMNLSTHSVPA